MAKKTEATEKRPASRTYTVNCLLLLTIEKTYPLEQARPTFCYLRLVKVLCLFLLTLEQARSNRCHVGSVCSSRLGGTTHLVDKRGALEQA